MINGAHSIIYSTKPDADKAFLRDVLGLPNIDVGHGWLIFGLPPSEVAVHPGEKNDIHEFYLMCEDVTVFVAAMKKKGVTCGPILDRGWGQLTSLSLPGGGSLSVYQPRHTRPRPMAVGKAKKDPQPSAAKAAKRANVKRPAVKKAALKKPSKR